MPRGIRLVWPVLAATVLVGCATSAPATSSASGQVVRQTPPPTRPAAASAATPASASPTVAPELVASPSEVGGWRPVPDQATVSGTQIDGVVWTGTSFVGVGAGIGEEGGTFLDSADGFTWNVRASDPTWQPMHLVAVDDGLVALGTVGELPASWRSPDGSAWTVATGAAAVPGTDLAVADGRWVAVGTRWGDGPCASYCEPVRGLTWTSDDGVRWTPAPKQASLATSDLKTIARFGDAWFAGGSAGVDAAVWSSPDGVHWSRVESEVFARTKRDFIGAVEDLVVAGTTLVAVGTDGGQDASHARAWWMTDGEGWHKAPMEMAADGQVFAATWAGTELLAVGPSSGCPGGIWSSSDGRAWACAAGGDRIAMLAPYTVAASGSIELVAGATNEGYDEDGEAGMPGAIWWRARP